MWTVNTPFQQHLHDVNSCMTPTQYSHAPNRTGQWTHLLSNNTYMSTAAWPQHNTPILPTALRPLHNTLILPTEHACEHTSFPTTPTWCQQLHDPNTTLPYSQQNMPANAPPFQQHLHDVNSCVTPTQHSHTPNSSATPTQHSHTPNRTCLQTHLPSNNTYMMSTAAWPQHNTPILPTALRPLHNTLILPTEHACEHTSFPTTPTWCQQLHDPNTTLPYSQQNMPVNAPFQQHLHDVNSCVTPTQHSHTPNSSPTPTQHSHTPNRACLWTHLLSNNTYMMSTQHSHTPNRACLWTHLLSNNTYMMSTQHSHTPNRTCLWTHLLSFGDATAGDDDDLALLLKVHHFSHAVGTAGVVDVTGRATRHGGVDHRVVVDAEHVHTTVLEELEKKQNAGTTFMWQKSISCKINKTAVQVYVKTLPIAAFWLIISMKHSTHFTIQHQHFNKTQS